MGRPKTLCVRARMGIVSRYELLDLNPPQRRMVGRKPVPTEEGGVEWVPTGDETVPYLHEYVHAIKDGSLWAADEATAAHVFGPGAKAHLDAMKASDAATSVVGAPHHPADDYLIDKKAV